MGFLENKIQLKISYFKCFFNQSKVINSLQWNDGSNIDYSIDQYNGKYFLDLNYIANDKHFNYRITFVSMLSNLGKGNLYYFLCPVSGKLARNLYLIDGMFVHRQACKGQFYESQTKSKKDRARNKYIFSHQGKFNRLRKINFGKMRLFYAGKQTKKFKALIILYREMEMADPVL